MNTNLALRTADYIEFHPETFKMGNWVSGTFVVDKLYSPTCGTSACIGGTAWALQHGKIDSVDVLRLMFSRDGRSVTEHFSELFEIDILAGQELFYLKNWEPSFKDSYTRAFESGDLVQAASIAAEYIRYFVGKYG